jgi:AbrB family looped-hinge helix DNA binding protein
MSEAKTSIRKISRGFQVTIPQEFRKELGLNIGDMVEFEKSENGLTVRPLEIMKRIEIVKSLKKVLSDQQDNVFSKLSEDEIMDLVNKEINQYRKEKQILTKKNLAV